MKIIAQEEMQKLDVREFLRTTVTTEFCTTVSELTFWILNNNSEQHKYRLVPIQDN